ncbi:MAG: funZ protein [Sphingomonadales bacterium]|nr:funZ protein [Sphingomonadales bacterium]
MLSVPQLNLGSIDAINYKTKDEREFFAKIIYKEEFLHKILEKKKYFLIGEKGTGKSSYSVFLHNSDYRNTLSRAVSLSQTDYRRFISMSTMGKFNVSSNVDIWKVILLLLVSDGIYDRFGEKSLIFQKFKNLKCAIDEYYSKAFRPEVDQSLDIVENSETAAKIMAKYIELGHGEKKELHQSFSSTQVNLAFLERNFRECLSSLKLESDFILFIDGIDIRPEKIDYESYIECIKGLANAAWELNTEFFANIKDSKKHIKVMLLMRPDILDNMGFQNLNAKVRDNGVNLDWMTTYDNFKNSPIFKLVCGTLKNQQDSGNLTALGVWNHYFPYETDNMRVSEKQDDPFVAFLRYSFYRPRDIVQYMQFMQDYVKQNESNTSTFSKESFYRCQSMFSDYLLGEVKDYLNFYHPTSDFDDLVGFFSEWGGEKEIGWIDFQSAFHRYRTGLGNKNITIKELTSSPEDLLQLLYSLNIIGYIEPASQGKGFAHYCFRDRTPVKLRPKVRYGFTYPVHPGLQRALLVGGPDRRGKR